MLKKRLTVCMAAALACVLLLGCGAGARLRVSDDNIAGIMIMTLPQSEEKARTYTSSEKIDKITEYLNGLSLDNRFSENPDDYAGETIVIAISYADGSRRAFYHFGNLFIKESDGDWLRMSYQQASQLDSLIQDNPSD